MKKIIRKGKNCIHFGYTISHLNYFIFALLFHMSMFRSRRIILTSLILLLGIFFTYSQDNNKWKLVKNNNGIKAFVKNQNDTKIKRVKVEAQVEASLALLITILKDAQCHNQWVFLNEHAEIVDSVSCNEWKYYGYSALPWPLSDRDFVTDVKMTQDSVDYSVQIVSHALPDFLPEKEGYVRIPYVFSSWTLNPLGNGEVLMTFELTIDLGGKIPLWFINLAVAKGPISTMQGLSDQVEKRKCNTYSISGIKEL